MPFHSHNHQPGPLAASASHLARHQGRLAPRGSHGAERSVAERGAAVIAVAEGHADDAQPGGVGGWVR